MAYVLAETINTTDTARYSLNQYAVADWHATQWTIAAATYTMAQLGFGLVRVSGASTGNIRTYVWSNLIGGAVSPCPGTLLATSLNTVDASTITASVVEYLWQFTGLALTHGTPYWFGLSCDAVDATNYIQVVRGSYNAARYHDQSGDGSTWVLKSNGYLYAKTYTSTSTNTDCSPTGGSSTVTGIAPHMDFGIVTRAAIRGG